MLFRSPGASPEEVEEGLALKIEDALADLDEVERITSTLAEGGGGIIAEFKSSVGDTRKAVEEVERAIDALTDLPEDARAHFMRVVFAVEAALREMLHPHKLNLASLGNVTPHLHWHVIPRYRDDPHFPNPIWGAQLRAPLATNPPPVAALRTALSGRLGALCA